MPDPRFPPVFDGHNDLLARLPRLDVPDPVAWFLDGGAEGHLDLPRMRRGGFAGGLFAVFVPSLEARRMNERTSGQDHAGPPPEAPAPAIDFRDALPVAMAMAATLFRIERESGGALSVCRTAADIRACMDAGTVAAVLHIEGAEPIDENFDVLDVLHQAGLRSLGPVWARRSIFGEGVPFRFQSDPDTGPGLTEPGRALVKACNRLRIAIDLSHLNEKGFWDVAELSDAPLVASHSNAHAVCPHARNLTDRQLRAIGETGGIAGLNFAVWFLRPDGRGRRDTALAVMMRHLDHMIAVAGVDHVGLGSDFDGAPTPHAIGDVAGLPRLLEAMREHGFDEETMRKICHGNWLRVLERTWGG